MAFFSLSFLSFWRIPLVRQFLRYFVTGACAFIIDFLVFAFCLRVLDWHYLLANFCGLLFGLALNYAMSILWAFNDCQRKIKNPPKEFAVFSFVGIAGIVVNQILMFLLIDVLLQQEFFSKAVAAVLVFLWNFGFRKMLLFKTRNYS